MKFEDVKIGMKVQVKQNGAGFYLSNSLKQGVVTKTDEGTNLNVRVDFNNDTCDWGNVDGIEPVVDVSEVTVKGCSFKTIEQQTLEQLLQSIQVALDRGCWGTIETLSKAYQRIATASNKTEVQPSLGEIL